MKKIYICGDSFGSTDPEYETLSWTELLSNRLTCSGVVINLSKVCASNLQISLQVDRAIADCANFIVYLATSSTRYDVELHSNRYYNQLLDRFVDITDADPRCDLTSYSSCSLDSTTRFNARQLNLLKNYHSEFNSLDLSIYANELIILATLSKLVESRIPFLFDQGGFEHSSFATSTKEYFKNYQTYKSDINIWDYVVGQPIFHRPYYHIQDPLIHQTISEYYFNKIIAHI